MSFSIQINIPGSSPQLVPLNGKSGMIGSSKSCQFPIEHREVSPQALLLDVRGGDFWIQNLNPYSIYVGMDEVTPNAWSPWSASESIQLTQSVSLTLINDLLPAGGTKGGGKGESEESPGGFNLGKLIQLLLIGVCFLGAGFVLLSPNSEKVSGVIDREFNFEKTVNKLRLESKNIEYDTVCKYLQQAWMADRRWRKSRPETVTQYYEMLLNHRLVRENPKNDPTLVDVSEYAKRRLKNLRYGK